MQVNIMLFIWGGLLALFLIAEFATVQLTTVWFAFGALVSLLLAAFGVENLAVQIIVCAGFADIADFDPPAGKKMDA